MKKLFSLWPFGKRKQADGEIMTRCLAETAEIIQKTGAVNPLQGLVPFAQPEELDESSYCICRCIIASALFANRTK